MVDSRYEIVRRIARGGMATVYLAHDRRLDRDVAFKLMHAHLADSPDFVARFRREARAAARLSGPGVVAVYDQGSIDGVAYLVMELVDGPHLRERIETGPISVGEALTITEQVLQPLAAAHRAGMIHRDIKPENVLLPADGSVAKVADFGLARAVTEATQTSSGHVLGTVSYLAPELVTAGTATPASDVFACGVMLFEILTGTQPMTADSPVQIAYRIVHEDVPAPSTLLPDLPAPVDELVARMTRRDPATRLPDADAALVAVREVRAGLTDGQLALQRAALADDAPGVSRTVSLPVGAIGREPASAGLSDTARLATSTPRSGTTQATRALAVDPLEADADEHAAASRPRSRHLGRRVAIGVGLLAVLGGAGGGAWYFLAGPGRTVSVPDVTGMSEQEATQALAEAELTWATPQLAYSDTVPEGQVMETSPAAGASVRVRSGVVATVSRGVEMKTVPDVVGATQDEVEARLTQAGLTLGDVSEEYSDTVPEGQVISCDPAAGQDVPHDSAVAVVVSKGRQPAAVPDVVGATEEAATAALKEAGLGVSGTTQAFSDDVPAGQVISSDPAAGAQGVFVGDSVALTVSKGPEMVTVPDITSKNEAEAKAALEAAGLTVTVSRVLGGLFGTARATDPAAGTSVRKGSTVTLYVV